MNGLYALTIILLIYAIGDLVATKTKAIISMLFVAAVIFAVCFWNGLPIYAVRGFHLSCFSSVTIGMMLVHMGTTIKLSDLIQEYKTVIIVLCSTLAICGGVYYIGRIFVEEYYALVSAPVLGGAVVACLVMTEAMNTVGATDAAAFGSLILIVQGIVGFPIASVCCKKEALRLKKEIAAGKLKLQHNNKDEQNQSGESFLLSLKIQWR